MGLIARRDVLPLAVVGAIALALMAVRMDHTQVGVRYDDARYIILAESFVGGQPYRLVNRPDAPLEDTWPPGYPLFFLSPVMLALGVNLRAFQLLSVGLALASGVVLLMLLRVLRFREVLCWGVVALWLLSPFLATIGVMVMSDIAYVFLSLLVLLLLSDASQKEGLWWGRLLLGVVLLCITVLVRYQGIALVAAVVLWMASQRRWRASALSLLSVTVVLGVFALFLRANGVSSAEQMEFIPRGLRLVSNLVTNVPVSARDYSKAVPYLILPAIGPRVDAWLAARSLVWLDILFSAVVMTVLAIGLVRLWRHARLLALYVLCYSALVLVVTINLPNMQFFDEHRYATALLPFLLLMFLLGLEPVINRVISPLRRPAWGAAALVLIGVVALRHVRDVRSSFPIADLSVGAQWLRDHTANDAVIAAPDSESRYLYLHRRTIPLFSLGAGDALACSVQGVDFILIAPTLGEGPGSPVNLLRQLEGTHVVEVLRAVQDDPQLFSLATTDPGNKMSIFRVNRTAAMSRCNEQSEGEPRPPVVAGPTRLLRPGG